MIPIRLAQELTYQLEAAGELDRLDLVLCELPIFVVLFRGEQTSVLLQWQRLSNAGYDPENLYQTKMSDPMLGKGDLYGGALRSLSNFFRARGASKTMAFYLQKELEYAREKKDRHLEADSLRLLGFSDILQGNYESALSHFTESKAVAESLNLTVALARVIGDIGTIYLRRGEIGLAERQYATQLELSESISFVDGVKVALGNLGVIEQYRGNFARAIEFYERSIAHDEQSGDKGGIALVLGNIANAYTSLGNYEEAGRCYETVVDLSERLGDLNTLGRALGNYGEMLRRIGQLEKALPLLRRALEIHRSTNYRYGMSYWLVLLANTMLDRAEKGYAPTRTKLLEIEQLLTEGLLLSKEISNAQVVHETELLYHRYYLAKGDQASAIATLETLLEKSTDEAQRARAQYFLWRITKAEHTREAAIAAMGVLIANAPLAEYKAMLAELRGEAIPKSAEDLEGLG